MQVFAKSSNFSALFANVKKFLDQHKQRLVFPEQRNPVEQSLPLIHSPSPTAQLTERGWFTASKPNNYSCSSRQLSYSVGALPEDTIAFASALLSPLDPELGLAQYVSSRTRRDLGLDSLSEQVGFDVGAHPSAKSHVALETSARLAKDVELYARQANTAATSELLALGPSSVAEMVERPGAAAIKAALKAVTNMIKALAQLRLRDQKFISTTKTQIMQLARSAALPTDSKRLAVESPGMVGYRQRMSWALAYQAGQEPELTMEFLLALTLSTGAEEQLSRLNPCLGPDERCLLLDMLAGLMFHSTRLGHINRCILEAQDLRNSLNYLRQQPESAKKQADSLKRSLALKQETLAKLMVCKRHFVRPSTSSGHLELSYDPRLLVFEFTHDLVLRKSQVELIDEFMLAATKGDSRVTQMIMGAGKTTVVAPLLALLQTC